MNERQSMPPAHERVWTLLPWYRNGSLDPAEVQLVETHLGECLVCSRELRALDRLAEAVEVPAQDHACGQAFLRLAAQIEAGTAPRPGVIARGLAMLRSLVEPVPLVAGAAVLVVSSMLAATIVLNGKTGLVAVEQPFTTLGQKSDAGRELGGPRFRVVLREAPGDAGLDAWLDRHGAALVDGPSEIGVLTVEIRTDHRTFDALLTEIRADAETIFVEPVHVLGTRPDRRR